MLITGNLSDIFWEVLLAQQVQRYSKFPIDGKISQYMKICDRIIIAQSVFRTVTVVAILKNICRIEWDVLRYLIIYLYAACTDNKQEE